MGIGATLKHNHHLLLAEVHVRAGTLAGVRAVPVEIVGALSRWMQHRPLSTGDAGMLVLADSDPKLNVVWRREVFLLWDSR